MKNLIICILLACCLLPIQAQEDTSSWKYVLPRHEVQIGIGDPVFSAISVDRIEFQETRRTINPDDWFNQSETYRGTVIATGSLSFEYMYRAKKWFWIGALVSYAGFYNNVYSKSDDAQVDFCRSHVVSVMPVIRFSWLNKKFVTLYSGLGLGIAANIEQTEKDLAFSPVLAAQFTGVGVQAGKKWFGFFELGIGTKGIMSIGFGYHFNRNNK